MRRGSDKSLGGSVLVILMIVGLGGTVSAQTFSRDLRVDIALNQVGFTPEASKQCVLLETGANSFDVVRTDTMTVVCTGQLEKSTGDFGTFQTGDFSELKRPGTYYVKAGPFRSFPFRIAPDVYDDTISMIVGYFALQRCGPSTTGYLTPCHCDDAVRMDNGKHQDATGGWHDASDLRKWVGATIHGMIGLSHVHELSSSESLRKRLLEELRWGNRYFLSMQEPAGYVMSHVGGDAVKHGDGNRWTDNVIGPEGGELQTVAPSSERSTKDITIVGDKDDRVIKTEPLNRLGQYKFVIAQARVARITRSEDPSYAETCLKAAKRCYEWCKREWPEKTTKNTAGGLSASLELHRVTGDGVYKEDAIKFASDLLTLQVTDPRGAQEAIRGFYRRSVGDSIPERDIWHGCWHLFGLCDLVELFPEHPKADQWRKAIRLYTNDYLSVVSRRNNFGIVPYGVFTEQDPGGDRQIGGHWYRYFMKPNEGWWVGINANIASAGIGLLRAAEVLDEPALLAVAQRQLDWIVGNNPFRASTIEGVGYNHPPQFVNSVEFYPPTPRLPGAVMNGLGGTTEDRPFMGEGVYHVSEYWTPMVAYTVWLMARLQHDALNAEP